MANMDIINAEDVRGIVLVDLDFDGTPELIVSRVFTNEYQWEAFDGRIVDSTYLTAEADIYTTSNNALVYIDSLYNFDNLVYQQGNVLGLKTLDNGDKAWFNMSREDRDNSGNIGHYLFTFDGEELDFTEVFNGEVGGLGDTDAIHYTFFGKPLPFVVKQHKEVCVDCDCEPDNTPYYSETYDCLYYGDFSKEGIFGKGEIYEFFKADWCADMSETTVNLYSRWLIDEWNNGVNNKKDLTDHEFALNIAKISNDFYTHGNIFMESFMWWFLGDYAKPIIYLYPEEPTDVEVRVSFPNGGWFTASYPDYAGGWNVTAHPDGTLINHADGREYSYLYWAGKGPANWDFSSGFVVKGTDTVAFLQEKLEYLGLIPREYNEFIVYYLPLLQKNEYNLITFQTTVYEQNAVMHITPEPDSILRIFMAYMPLDKPVNIPEQKLERFERTGFAVIEWGGTTVN